MAVRKLVVSTGANTVVALAMEKIPLSSTEEPPTNCCDGGTFS
jgi:hypothetical protein